MKQLTFGALAVLALLAGITVSNGFAQKIAVLDSREVLSSMPESQTASAQVQALQKKWQDSLQLMQTQLQAKADAYKKILDQMTQEKKDAVNQELAQGQDALIRYRDEKFGQDGELTKQQGIILQPIFDKVNAALSALVKKEKYTIVFDKKAVLNSDGAIDITQKLIDALKAGK